jgi:hypothetical protein
LLVVVADCSKLELTLLMPLTTGATGACSLGACDPANITQQVLARINSTATTGPTGKLKGHCNNPCDKPLYKELHTLRPGFKTLPELLQWLLYTSNNILLYASCL